MRRTARGVRVAILSSSSSVPRGRVRLGPCHHGQGEPTGSAVTQVPGLLVTPVEVQGSAALSLPAVGSLGRAPRRSPACIWYGPIGPAAENSVTSHSLCDRGRRPQSSLAFSASGRSTRRSPFLPPAAHRSQHQREQTGDLAFASAKHAVGPQTREPMRFGVRSALWRAAPELAASPSVEDR